LIRWKPWFSLLALAGIAYAIKQRLRHGFIFGCIGFYAGMPDFFRTHPLSNASRAIIIDLYGDKHLLAC
jgi:hypothetical protein